MFRTELDPKPNDFKIDHTDHVLSLGSCFAVHVGQKLIENKFPSLINPFGTIFNPLSIFRLLKTCIVDDPIPEWSFLQNQGVHRNYFFHSDISALTYRGLTAKIDVSIKETRDFLSKTNVLILTFGTAIVYELKENAHVVANCHKMPADTFTKRMLSVEEIVTEFDSMFKEIKASIPDIKVILTVSPVRHIKDSIERNSVSKSILRLAVNEIAGKHKKTSYFPSYELMMDDLRDYRFYADDLVHPNSQAIAYIWEKFQNTFFEKHTMA